MRMTAVMGMIGAGALSACGAPQGASTGMSSAAGTYPVTLDGATYSASIRPGPAGEVLTRAGAQPVQGRTVTVTRDGAAMGFDEGLTAKKVAVQACADARGRVNKGAVAHYAGGAWVFEGGCA